MSSAYPRGFKADCTRLAADLRTELGLAPLDRLDPRLLAELYGIPVLELSELRAFGASATAVRSLVGSDRGCFSALTVFEGTRRLIVENPAHSIGRRANSVAHELGHLFLEHEPQDHFADGCRKWNAAMERQADWLAGELLVTREAALRIVRDGVDRDAAAAELGVSTQLLTWRINITGTARQVQRARARWGR